MGNTETGMKQHNNLELHVKQEVMYISGTALWELQKTEDATEVSPEAYVE